MYGVHPVVESHRETRRTITHIPEDKDSRQCWIQAIRLVERAMLKLTTIHLPTKPVDRRCEPLDLDPVGEDVDMEAVV